MPAGNLLSDVGFPSCAFIIGEERGFSAGRSPPCLCLGLACGMLLSPTGFIYSHARQGGFSHSSAGSGLLGVLASVLAAVCPAPARRPGKAAPHAPGVPPSLSSPAWEEGGGRNCPAWGASSPGSPTPNP